MDGKSHSRRIQNGENDFGHLTLRGAFEEMKMGSCYSDIFRNIVAKDKRFNIRRFH